MKRKIINLLTIIGDILYIVGSFIGLLVLAPLTLIYVFFKNLKEYVFNR